MAVKFTCQLVAYTTFKFLQIDSCHLDVWNLVLNETRYLFLQISSDCMKDAQGYDIVPLKFKETRKIKS